MKPTVKNPDIIVFDFTYIADSEFESHVTHHYEWIGDKLIIGKFCQIAKWWDKSIDEINELIPLLTCINLDQVKSEIRKNLPFKTENGVTK